MAQLMNVKLSRFDATPWGFRLQGGKDFGAPLVIQKVNGGSPAEKAGLQAGDAVIKVNDMEVFNLRHKEAQDNIVRAGNNFEVTIQRGGSTWKPLVAPVGAVPSTPSANIQPVTKTSLAAKKHDYTPVGSAHNFAPKPFAPQVNGDATIKSIVSKQYNTPVAIYSEETIAETLSAQAEVLAGGVLGVNFKKNERNYNAANSEVFKMVHEIDNEPRTPEPAVTVLKQIPGRLPHMRHEDGNNAAPKQAFIDPRRPPQPRKPDPSELEKPRPSPVPPAVGLVGLQMLGTNLDEDTDPENSKTYCFNCGVFVRIKDKNLHVECFKCATCGTSLKNVGYYNIHNKLYCDIHAKLVARQNPPAPNLEPVTVPPGGRVPGAGAISAAINAAAASAPLSAAPSLPPLNAGNMSPQPATLGPMPFHTPSAVSAPKPSFSAPSAPSATQPRPVSVPSAGGAAPGGGGSKKGAAFAGATAPRRGRGVLNQPTSLPAGARIPLCGHCNGNIRGPFITALGKIWCPEHFVCVNAQCRRQLADIGFVEEQGGLYCEYCFEQYLAPPCDKCTKKIKGDCVNAIGKHYHPECFVCAYCSKLFGNNPFFLEDGLPYCETDWNELFTTKCFACGFPIEAGDRWVEALSNNYHSQCFNCTSCKKNLEGQSFFAKGGRPFCKTHAR